MNSKHPSVPFFCFEPFRSTFHLTCGHLEFPDVAPVVRSSLQAVMHMLLLLQMLRGSRVCCKGRSTHWASQTNPAIPQTWLRELFWVEENRPGDYDNPTDWWKHLSIILSKVFFHSVEPFVGKEGEGEDGEGRKEPSGKFSLLSSPPSSLKQIEGWHLQPPWPIWADRKSSKVLQSLNLAVFQCNVFGLEKRWQLVLYSWVGVRGNSKTE